MSQESNKDSRKQGQWRDQEFRKFVSDEDIVGRTKRPTMEDRFQGTRPEGKDQPPKFISDEDIVRRRVA